MNKFVFSFSILLFLDSFTVAHANGDLENYFSTCSGSKLSNQIVADSKISGSSLNLLANGQWLPNVFVRRQQTANFRGRLIESNFGFSGAVPFIPTWLLLKGSANLEENRQYESARAAQQETLDAYSADYYRLHRIKDSLSLLKSIQSVLQNRAEVAPNELSSELLHGVIEANTLSNRIEDLTSQVQKLSLRFEKCDSAAEPKWQEMTITAEALARPSLVISAKTRSCAAELSKSQLDASSQRWSWLPQVRYSYSYSFETNTPSTSNSDWSIALQMQIPIFNLMQRSPTSINCELQLDQAVKKEQDQNSLLASVPEQLPRLRQSIVRMKKILPQATSEAINGHLTLKKYTELARDFIDLVDRVATLEGVISTYFMRGEP